MNPADKDRPADAAGHQAECERQATVQANVARILHEALSTHSERELGDLCLTVAQEMTASPLAFIGELGDDGLAHDIAMSGLAWERCAMRDKTGHRRPPGDFEIRGLYGRVISDGRSVRTNDPAAHPDSGGTPEGHPALTAFLGVPLLSGGRVIGMIAVANRAGGYGPEDQDSLEALAPAMVEAFERTRAEQELALAKQRLEAHIDNSPLATIEFDARFRVTRWSEETERMFGWKASEILGRAISEFKWVYEEDVEIVQRESGRLFAGEAPRSMNVNRNYRKDGSVIWCEWYSSAVYDGGGALVSVLSQVLDITERKRAQEALEDEKRRLRQIIEGLPIGVALVDGDGSVLEINDANNRVWAGTLPKARSVAEYGMYRGFHRDTGEPVRPDEWPGARAIESGERVEETVDVLRLDGERAPARIEAIPIKDRAGGVSRVLVVTEDVTQRLEAQRLSEGLTEIGAEIGATLDFHEILRRVVETSARVLGVDSASLTVKEADGWVVRESFGMPRKQITSVLTDSLLEQVLSDAAVHEPLAVNDVATDPRVNAGVMSDLGIRSLLAVPVVVQHNVIAVLAYHHRSEKKAITPGQCDFAAKLMGIVSLALENARLYERERNIADALQQAVLSPPAAIEGLNVAYLYRTASETANVGGDFYDVFELSPGRVGILIGDVSGKGLIAARLTSLLRDGVRSYSYVREDPGWVMSSVNELVHRSSPTESFATAFFGVLDLATGSLRYCRAGHPSALAVGAEGVRHLPEEHSTILGAFENARFEVAETELPAGNKLVLYTDGVIEARKDGTLFGETRLIAALDELRGAGIDEVPPGLLGSVLEFTGGTLPVDTVILVLERPARAR